jgi:molybdate transport system substrate-binding protein
LKSICDKREREIMKKIVGIVLVMCMVLTLVGCGAANETPSATVSAEPTTAATEAASATPEATEASAPTAAPVELTIAAAASLTDVTAEIAEAYKTVAPNVTLTFTYGASGALQTQIEEGAPVDIFMSAAQKQMDALADESLLLDSSHTNLLENKVVMIVPTNSTLGLASFDDLAKDTVKTVAIGDLASVPAGQYAEEVLTSLGIKDKVEAKANLGTDVRQVLTWVENGEVDAGIVYATDAATTDKVTVVCEAPADRVKKIIYPVAILKASTNAEAAQAFIDYLKTADIAALFEKYGFKMVE